MKKTQSSNLLRRFLAGLLLCLLLVPPVYAAESSFTDVTGTEYYAQAAAELSGAGILTGYSDGTFRAGKTITRAEMAAVICRMMNLPLEEGGTSFSDVPWDYWAVKYIAAAQKAGIISGDGKGSFRPGDNVKYEEAVKMVICAIGQGEGITSSGANWAEGYLKRAQVLGVTDNLSGAKISTRGDVAVMVYNALNAPAEGTVWKFLFVILPNNNFTAKNTAGETVHDTHVMDQEELDIITNAIHAFETDMPVISQGKVQPQVDMMIIDTPITNLSTCSSGPWFSHEDAYAILKDRVNLDNYDHVTVIGDLRSLKLGYWGLGGTWFKNGTGYTFIKAADTNLWAMRDRWAPEVFVHELLHFASNWAELRGYKVPVHLHSSEQYGYKETNETGEKDWLVDFVNNAVPAGNGTYAGIPADVWTMPPRHYR